MIEELRIADLGVISRAELELGPGFTVITGETGAGKTMLLTGLDLLLGGRADAALVRPGADRAVVEGRFIPVPGSPALARAQEAGADLDEDVLILARSLAAQGRSRAFLGGRSVPQAVLAEVGASLVTVHGQSEQLRLRSAAQQRAALDEFAGPAHLERVAAYRTAHVRLRDAEAELDRWRAGARARALETTQLAEALGAVDALDPQPGEDLALREEADRLGNVEELRAAVEEARTALEGAESGEGDRPGAVGAVEAARRALAHAESFDAVLAGWAERLGDVSYLLADLAAEVGQYLAGLDADPDRLAHVHARRAELAALARSYGVRWDAAGADDRSADSGDPPAHDGRDGSDPGRGTGTGGAAAANAPEPGTVDAVLAWATHARRRLDRLTSPEDGEDALVRRVAELRSARDEVGAQVTAGRRDAAARLAESVDAELAGLAMSGAHLTVELTALEEAGPTGAEDATFVLSAHEGAPARPLALSASGGELSRVMLAIEVALAARRGEDAAATFVFDEVDAGVGGRAAVEVGRRLAELARTAQVVVVTHLAQVAAFADRHVVVAKETNAGVTSTGVRVVSEAEREEELARMLSGDPESTQARRHAAELLARDGVGR